MPTQPIIPIDIQKRFDPENFPGRQGIEDSYHFALEGGRFADHSISDAINSINEAKQQLIQRVTSYMNLSMVAGTAQAPDPVRPPKLAADIIKVIKVARQLIQEIQGLIKGLLGQAQYLLSMISRIRAFIQARLNSIATLINQICNFNLPDLPSIPNILGGIYFDGFAFPRGAFDFSLKFDANFAFSTCKIRTPNVDIFRNYPKTALPVVGANGVVSSGAPKIIPPLPNSRVATLAEMQDSVKLKAIRGSKDPIFPPEFVPYGNFFGALPKPTMILSSFELLPSEFKDQVVSLVGVSLTGLTPPNNGAPISDKNLPGTIFSTGGSGSSNLDRATLQNQVRAFLASGVTLEALEASGWDWIRVWAWAAYLGDCRAARKGLWISPFEDVYQTWVAPSYVQTLNQRIPWNQHSSTPVVPLDILRIKVLPEAERKALLWKLSYVEASLLDYPRCTSWDDAAVVGYVDGPTRADLDYVKTSVDLSNLGLSVVLESKGKAEYPSKLTYPEGLHTTLTQVIAMGLLAIGGVKDAVDLYAKMDGLEPGNNTIRLDARVIYTPRAERTDIDFHSQFWKEFALRWADLMQGNPLVLAVVCNYPALLNSAINPLASRTPYYRAKQDSLERVWSWVRGTPFLPTPYIPAMLEPAAELRLAPGAPNGWGGVCPKNYDPATGLPVGNFDAKGNPVPLKFDLPTFTARPDIQALDPNTRDTLIYYNQAYADLLMIEARQVGLLEAAKAGVEASIAQGQAFVDATLLSLTKLEADNQAILDSWPH